MEKIVATGVVHNVPADLRVAILARPQVTKAWNTLTPLGRNEWICWTISVMKKETRENHIERLISEVAAGKRRPCCWPGCPYR